MRKSQALDQLLAEKDRRIAELQEQIDWLRAQLGRPSFGPPLNPSEQPEVAMAMAPFVNEDEEDVQAMLDAGRITKDQIPDVLEALGFSNTEISLG